MKKLFLFCLISSSCFMHGVENENYTNNIIVPVVVKPLSARSLFSKVSDKKNNLIVHVPKKPCSNLNTDPQDCKVPDPDGEPTPPSSPEPDKKN